MDETDLVGRTVSHYRITERLGGGGMGVVYKAVDVRLNRHVALKFLSADMTKDPDAKERFIHEAQAASALDHPNICTIHEIDETPDRELFLTMAYYEGETLKHRIERGPLTVDEALDVATQVSQALARAHESGIVHRDIKPANLMLPKDGPVKIVDFGIAKLVGQSDITKTGTTVGTVAYMPPEYIRGVEPGPAADVWAIGVVLYEMLAGRRPFEGKDDLAVISRILDEAPPPLATARPRLPDALLRIVARALDKNAAHRYPSATELLTDLRVCRATLTPGQPPTLSIASVLRRPLVAVGVAVLLAAVAVPAALAYRRASRTRWARTQAMPEIQRLIDTDRYKAAFALAKQVEPDLSDDPAFRPLWPRFSAEVSITTDPPGARVLVQEYSATDDRWEPIGTTPIKGVRLPRGPLRLRIEKAGFEPQLIAATNPGTLLQNAANRLARPLIYTLAPSGSHPEMVRVPGGAFPVPIGGFDTSDSIALTPFWIDRLEVTNRVYKQFVDRGAYAKSETWDGLPFERDGRSLAWKDAVAMLHDSTDRPGPAGWEVGAYPSGQDEWPVVGVSWFEAAAFCRAAGKSLPTLFHWARAALPPDEMFSPLAPSIIPASNFTGAVARAGTYKGIGPYGTVDMAGNAREWIWNEAVPGRRWIAGGGFNDADWMLLNRNSVSPFDRSIQNGFRCTAYDAPPSEALLARVDDTRRDYRTATPVSDEVFNVFKRQFAYVRTPVNARVDATDTRPVDWTREKITLDAGYESERLTIYLFLPRHASPPHQAVILFPGLSAFAGRASSDGLQPLDYVVRSGRAYVMPVFKGSYERWDSFLNLSGEERLRGIRTRMLQWRQELGHVIDLLESRPEIDASRIAYAGVSFGASMPLPLLALEERLKTAILLAPGFSFRSVPPEADALNYVAHITMPVLAISGRQDYVFPYEESAKPLFERLGTPAEHKRQVLFDAGHVGDLPRSQVLREVLGWLDKYLGPVKPAG